MRTTGVLGQKSDAEGTVAQPFYWRQAVRELGWIEEWIHGQIVAYGPPTFRRANVLTLSCKTASRASPGKRRGGCRDQHAVAGANCSRRDAREQFEPPEAARRRASGPAVFVSL